MSTFPLQIVTPDGLFYSGEAEKLIVRTVGGDVCILPNHCDYVTALGMGEAVVVSAEGRRTAACIGGLLAVTGGRVRLVPTTFEWAEEIDKDRARRAEERARKHLEDKSLSKRELELARAHLLRALVRSDVAKRSK